MDIIIMIAQLLLALTILVFVHELGHFLAAKLFKTKVEKFYLFFDFLFPLPNVLNFAIWKKKIGETEYGFGWFPLGGYVSIAGMVDETQDAEALPAEHQPWEYRSKRSWQKMIIILGGIIFNIIFGIMIFSALLKYEAKEYLPVSDLKTDGVVVSELGKSFGFRDGEIVSKVNGEIPKRMEDLTPISSIFGASYEVERMENGKKINKTIVLPNSYLKQYHKDLFLPAHHYNIAVDFAKGSNAEKAGLKANDTIISIDSIPVKHFDFFRKYVQKNKGKNVAIEVKRGGVNQTLSVPIDSNGLIGIRAAIGLYENAYHFKNYSWGEAIQFSISDCYRLFALQAINIVKMLQGEVKPKDSVGGIISIAKAYGNTWDWGHFWTLTGMISIALAFMNLLPIPGLDGGHAIIIIIEAILRRPLSPKVLQIIQNIGLYLILALTVYVFYVDLTRK